MGLGFTSSSQSSSSEQGISGANRQRAFEPAFDFANRLGFTGTNLFESPAPVVPLNERGLMPQQESFMNSLFSGALSKASAGGAFKGRLTPEYTPAYIGSALQNIAPFIMDMIQKNIMQSIFGPEQVRQGRIQTGAQAINPLLTLSTGGSTSTGAGSSFGLDTGIGFNFGGGGGGGKGDGGGGTD